MSNSSNHLELKRVFNAIVNGYSSAIYKNKTAEQKIRIKHFTLSDQVDLDGYYELTFDRVKQEGLPTEDDVITQLKRKGFWKQSEEDKIKTIKLYIERLKQTKGKQSLPSHVEQTQKMIDDEENKLAKLNYKKISQIGETCEKFAATRLNNYFIFKSFYNNSGSQLFSDEEFDNLDDSEIEQLVKLYNSTINIINTKNIKLICLQPFFQNYFYLTDNLSDFWGKPIIQLTNFQSEISAYARYFKQLLNNSKDIPDEIRSDPDKLIDFVSSSNNIKEETKERGEHSMAVVGATKEDLQSAGLQTGNPLALQARKKKEGGLGSLTSVEIQQIQEGQTLYS